MSSKKKEPEKKRPKVYIVGGGFDYIKLMYRLGCDGAKGLDDADVVLFTGGEDVNPELYGEVPLAKTHFSRERDNREVTLYHGAVDRDLPMIGICRGGQFLNVMNGGKMWQHVNNHAGSHLAHVEVPPFNGDKRRIISVTSTHHQMMIPTDDAFILATANVCSDRMSPSVTKTGKSDDEPDIEVVWYQDTNCLCFQPHPELPNCPADCVDFFEECLDNYIYPSIPHKMVSNTVAQGSTKVC